MSYKELCKRFIIEKRNWIPKICVNIRDYKTIVDKLMLFISVWETQRISGTKMLMLIYTIPYTIY